jgi:hypothetical protein
MVNILAVLGVFICKYILFVSEAINGIPWSTNNKGAPEGNPLSIFTMLCGFSVSLFGTSNLINLFNNL